ncbi:unnamed protein product [Schistosoma curassoni]|uniref:Ovule protein n=1 Tax=Schistosoma curassoni TaxID=6186 RepID=A0A183JYH2_9TREM|nr:unnamed protein product [Schistosoma curassoni]
MNIDNIQSHTHIYIDIHCRIMFLCDFLYLNTYLFRPGYICMCLIPLIIITSLSLITYSPLVCLLSPRSRSNPVE